MRPQLYHLSVISYTGATIYEQQLGNEIMEKQLLQTISTIALGFKNTIDVNISSINYLEYTIYFKRGMNFLAVLLANNGKGVEELINKMFTDLLEQNILSRFIEYANHDIRVNNDDITSSIHRIMYNLDFISSLSEFKQQIKGSTQRF